MGRPKGSVGRKHLTPDNRLRIRTLYFDARMGQKQIELVTGFSSSQIRTAIRAESHLVGQRSGRPRKSLKNQPEKDRQDGNLEPPAHDMDAAGEKDDEHLDNVASIGPSHIQEQAGERELEGDDLRSNSNTTEKDGQNVNLGFMTEFNDVRGEHDQNGEDEGLGRPGE
ncbi:hypothetical protein B0H67DRAFT_567528 [Lasiosphaeris hirsuta]|uniref:Uncharacterized protein n=1 Tax=Lasiosphaeris hirsuta TaxID=260670 RepID=A0AA40AYA9_9PEZI|nr:hypothetical protein B0H67DRAFT_567528 [Lasiosphaeris hirsuta]